MASGLQDRLECGLPLGAEFPTLVRPAALGTTAGGEPAWHRNSRRRRAKARSRLKEAVGILGHHHGSVLPRMARKSGHDDALAEVARLAASMQKCMLRLGNAHGSEGKRKGGGGDGGGFRLGKRGARDYEARPGDWECEQCGFERNFASRQECYDCGERRTRRNGRGSSPRGAGNSRPILGKRIVGREGKQTEGNRGGRQSTDRVKDGNPRKLTEPTAVRRTRTEDKEGFTVVDKSKGSRPRVGEREQPQDGKGDADEDMGSGLLEEGTQGGSEQGDDAGEEEGESHEDQVSRLKAQWDRAEQAVVMLRRQGWGEGEGVYDIAREGAKAAEDAWRTARGPLPFYRRQWKARDAVSRCEGGLGKARAELERFREEMEERERELESKVQHMEEKLAAAKEEVASLHREEAEQEGWVDYPIRGKAAGAVSEASGQLRRIGPDLTAALELLEDSEAKQRLWEITSDLYNVTEVLEDAQAEDGPERYDIDSQGEHGYWGKWYDGNWMDWSNDDNQGQEVGASEAAQAEAARSAERSRGNAAKEDEIRVPEDADL